MKINQLFYLPILLIWVSCKGPSADLVLFNGNIYTVDSAFSKVEAMAIKDGKIIAVGSNEELSIYAANEKIDLKGKFVYPGLIDAHCHFYGYGVDLKKINLTGTPSWEAILDTLLLKKEQKFMGWIFGRGWDQNDWTVANFPDKTMLDSLFPDVPVFLMRIDGHAAIVNQKALEISGIDEKTIVKGGEIEIKNGKATGLLFDNAVDLVKLKIPEPTRAAQIEALLSAQKNCFAVGLTTVADAGVEKETILLVDSLQKLGSLKMRYYGMISYNAKNKAYFFQNGKMKTERLTISSFKIYADGALGSRGALLLEPYSDQSQHYGYWLIAPDSFKQACSEMAAHNFQLNTHCIGDSANRTALNYYIEATKNKKDTRWRIEHAQVVNEADFGLFSAGNIIPSVQPSHATSDMYWAEKRLGSSRMKGAYAYATLLRQTGKLAAGSDFPVEDINPLYGYYAAVTRRDKSNFPENGFQMKDALTREEALKAMTIWAAYANFEEQEKGSLESGKVADFVILGEDLMKVNAEKIVQMKVDATYVNGEKVFDRK